MCIFLNTIAKVMAQKINKYLFLKVSLLTLICEFDNLLFMINIKKLSYNLGKPQK